MEQGPAVPRGRAAVGAAAGVLVAVSALYFALAGLAGQPFSLSATPPDRYGLLTEAWLSGQLHLKAAPDPALLALPDPWDPAQNRPFRTPGGTQDASLYEGRLYYYFGPAPVVVLFAPFRLLTGRYLREEAAVPLFATALVGFAWAAVRRVARRCGWPWDAGRSAAVAALIGLTPLLAFACRTPETYETAIVAAAAFAAAGVFFASAAVAAAPSPWTLAAAGLAFGLAFASRPTHAAEVVLLAAASIAVGRGAPGPGALRRAAPRLVALWAPWLLVVALVLIHNWARFGRPGEFGVHYALSTWPHRTATNLAPRFIPVNLTAYLVAPPLLAPQFPFLHLLPGSLPARPPGYMTVEAVAGILWCLPALLLLPIAVFLPARAPAAAREMTAALLAQASAMLGLLACFRWAAARYLLDVLPFLAVAAAIGWCAPVADGWRGRARRAVAAVLLAQAVAVNLAVGLTGKYDVIAGRLPRRLEAAAAPLQRFWLRHAASSYGDIAMTVTLPDLAAGERETLLAAGTVHRREVLCVEGVGQRRTAIVLMSRGGEQTRTPPLRLARGVPHAVEIEMGALLPLDAGAMARIWPAEPVEEWRRRLRIRVDGEEVLAAAYDFRPPSPYVRVGSNWFGPDYCPEPFRGRIDALRRRLPVPVP